MKTPKPGFDRLYRIDEVAELLGLKSCTVRKWMSLRKLGFCKVRGATRIPESEVERLVRFVPPREER
jgi:excisionase family DNA binding protein